MERRWIRIAESINEIPFDSNNLVEADADGKTICLARSKDQIYAVAQKCPHSGGFLAQGFVDAMGNVVCPLHRYRFCPSNGRNVSGEGYYLKHWPVEVREDGVYVGLEMDRGFLGWI